MKPKYDLLSTVESGGCSAKLAAKELAELLDSLPRMTHPDLLVDIDTHDDAGVFRIDSERALVQTVDFFPPVCSDPYDFGQIAAANALSDVYAMGGRPLTAMNIMLFPGDRIPLEVMGEILRGGQDKVKESGAVIVGGHTINDYPPKYGLSVTGMVHPEKIITNAGVESGDILILTKPIGTGVIIAGKKTGLTTDKSYSAACQSMKTLNARSSEILSNFEIKGGTDVTGFSLAGHALKMALASNVTIEIDSKKIPLLPGALNLAEDGCLPGATFRNYEFAGGQCEIHSSIPYALKMLLFDAQTSGGLLFALRESVADEALLKLTEAGIPAAIIGNAITKNNFPIIVR